ncbi:MAG: VWA domain-containing protein [Patescibacteria group bacterium]|nr:VWA domain-containing protein [Patescibacteria group bacterium]
MYKTSQSGRGGLMLVLLLIILFISAVFFADGIFPKVSEESLNPKAGESVVVGGQSTDGTNTLQLQTVKFKDCLKTITVDLLLDRSGSMGSLTPSKQTKINRLKEAVLSLVSKFNDSSIIGIQSFNSLGIADDIPISFYKDVKNIIPKKVNALSANGATPTHDALAFSYEKLREAVAKPEFKDRKFNFIFISDGAPCPGIGCGGTAGQNQDPRIFDPNPADQIKDLGVNVFTLGIYDSYQAKDPELANLLKSIASKPENYYEANNADEVNGLLNAITAKICQ